MESSEPTPEAPPCAELAVDREFAAYSDTCWWLVWRFAFDAPSSWPGLTRPSMPHRPNDESHISVSANKVCNNKPLRPLRFLGLIFDALITWMAGTSPAMTP
jgi:hypothetical protein